MNEKLSALLDDELSEHERAAVLRQLGRDRQLQGAWERYHVIRGVLRRELGALASPDLAVRIQARVADELPGPSPVRGAWSGRPMIKAASALAIAASVAAIAVITIRPSAPPDVPSRTAAVQTGAPPVARITQEPAAVANARDSALNAMLVKHSEFSPAVGMNGLASYVRVVGHGADRDSGEK